MVHFQCLHSAFSYIAEQGKRSHFVVHSISTTRVIFANQNQNDSISLEKIFLFRMAQTFFRRNPSFMSYKWKREPTSFILLYPQLIFIINQNKISHFVGELKFVCYTTLLTKCYLGEPFISTSRRDILLESFQSI